MSPDVLTWLTRGVSKSADCFPRHLIANRIQRQHLSVIRTSPWYLSHARDSTGQTCCKTQYRRTERATNQIYAKKKKLYMQNSSTSCFWIWIYMGRCLYLITNITNLTHILWTWNMFTYIFKELWTKWTQAV